MLGSFVPPWRTITFGGGGQFVGAAAVVCAAEPESEVPDDDALGALAGSDGEGAFVAGTQFVFVGFFLRCGRLCTVFVCAGAGEAVEGSGGVDGFEGDGLAGGGV